MQMGFVSDSGVGPLLPLCNAFPVNNGAVGPGWAAALDSADVTVGNRKRPWNSGPGLSFLGEDISALVHHQLIDIDQLITQHTQNVRTELTERRKRFLNQITVAMEEAMSKQLNSKQEELERMSKLNWAMQERIKSLLVENQLWRELAQSNEATANVLRSNLEHVLAAQLKAEEEQECVEAAATAEDAQSCCYGDNENDERAVKRRRTMCARCRDGEPTVVMLPCRHLCLCSECEVGVEVCPVCECKRTASLVVNVGLADD